VSLTLITAPAIEPVTLHEMKLQCGFGPLEDTDKVRSEILAEQLRSAIAAARQDCEDITGRAFVTQTWNLTLDHFPRFSDEYLVHNRLDIGLPLPKFGSLTAFTYIDFAGVLQDNMAPGAWGYQLVAGGDTRQARLRPPVFMAWPWNLWHVANSVSITFKCGYGGPVTATTTAASAILTGPKWNQGDAGLALSIPGAGVSGAALVTTIASVDVNGRATLATAATVAVMNATAYAGGPVPATIRQAIKLNAQWFYDNCEGPQPPAVKALLSMSGNLIV
jgi:hypothetical protein